MSKEGATCILISRRVYPSPLLRKSLVAPTKGIWLKSGLHIACTTMILELSGMGRDRQVSATRTAPYVLCSEWEAAILLTMYINASLQRGPGSSTDRACTWICAPVPCSVTQARSLHDVNHVAFTSHQISISRYARYAAAKMITVY